MRSRVSITNSSGSISRALSASRSSATVFAGISTADELPLACLCEGPRPLPRPLDVRAAARVPPPLPAPDLDAAERLLAPAPDARALEPPADFFAPAFDRAADLPGCEGLDAAFFLAPPAAPPRLRWLLRRGWGIRSSSSRIPGSSGLSHDGHHYDLRVTRHFLTGEELSADELDALLERALQLKADRMASAALAERSVALVFERPSTRTRVSFEVGVHELGGHAVVLRGDELQLSRGESPRDTALVLSRQVAAVGVPPAPDETLAELAAYSDVPIVNMLTAGHHPCQALADLLTLREAHGSLGGLRLAYVGDGNNVARSLALLGTLAGVDVAVASPAGYALEADLVPPDGATGRLSLHEDPQEAVAGASAVYTDVWVSM